MKNKGEIAQRIETALTPSANINVLMLLKKTFPQG